MIVAAKSLRCRDLRRFHDGFEIARARRGEQHHTTEADRSRFELGKTDFLAAYDFRYISICGLLADDYCLRDMMLLMYAFIYATVPRSPKRCDVAGNFSARRRRHAGTFFLPPHARRCTDDAM